MATYGDWSDEALRKVQNGTSRGHARAAGYLLEVPQEVRAEIESNGNIMANVSPGYRYADGVYEVCRIYKRGGDWRKYARANSEMIERERMTGPGTQIVTPSATVAPNPTAEAADARKAFGGEYRSDGRGNGYYRFPAPSVERAGDDVEGCDSCAKDWHQCYVCGEPVSHGLRECEHHGRA